jgi:hypothetical protein
VSVFNCGGLLPAIELPDAGDGICCAGAAMFGPQRCTCWTPVFDLEQQQPKPGTMAARSSMCPDCAYRGGSPERRGEDGYQGDEDSLGEMVATGSPFVCHQGMRKPARYRHPSGAETAGHPAAYEPPVIDGVAYKADGTPADLCFGWSLRRAAFLREAQAS